MRRLGKSLAWSFDVPWHPGGMEVKLDAELPPKALVLPVFPARQEPNDEEKGELSARFNEINRVSAAAMRLLQQAESSLQKLSVPEQKLATTTIQQLQKEAEAAEEMSLPMTKAVKFHKVELEGGYTSENVKVLCHQSSDACARVNACMRMARAIIP